MKGGDQGESDGGVGFRGRWMAGSGGKQIGRKICPQITQMNADERRLDRVERAQEAWFTRCQTWSLICVSRRDLRPESSVFDFLGLRPNQLPSESSASSRKGFSSKTSGVGPEKITRRHSRRDVPKFSSKPTVFPVAFK
jgi:hypothetical protein